jgi:hypothetical protein
MKRSLGPLAGRLSRDLPEALALAAATSPIEKVKRELMSLTETPVCRAVDLAAPWRTLPITQDVARMWSLMRCVSPPESVVAAWPRVM